MGNQRQEVPPRCYQRKDVATSPPTLHRISSWMLLGHWGKGLIKYVAVAPLLQLHTSRFKNQRLRTSSRNILTMCHATSNFVDLSTQQSGFERSWAQNTTGNHDILMINCKLIPSFNKCWSQLMQCLLIIMDNHKNAMNALGMQVVSTYVCLLKWGKFVRSPYVLAHANQNLLKKLYGQELERSTQN